MKFIIENSIAFSPALSKEGRAKMAAYTQRFVDHINALETQLAEERAKREAAETDAAKLELFVDLQKERADRAESELAGERFENQADVERWTAEYQRAEKAAKELAEAQASASEEDMARLAMRDRAKRAEARVAELEGVKATLVSGMNAQTKAVAELQALVDAATKFTFDNVAVIRIVGSASSWWVCPPNKPHEVIDTRDEAIALARDLAAKEREPTR